MKIKKLVIDTAAFLRNVPLWEYADEFFTVPEVIAEIKDRQTKHLINSLPIELKIQTPSPSSLQFIIEFVKKTGDYAGLSIADIKVLALTYELEVQANGSNEHLRQVPLQCRTEINAHKPSSEASKPSNIEGFYRPKGDKEKSTSKFDDAHGIDNLIADEIERTFMHNSNHFNDLQSKMGSVDLLNLTFSHLNFLNDHLKEFSYIGGYLFTYEDAIVMEALSKSFPLLCEVLELSNNLLASGNGTFIFKLYRDLFLDMPSEAKLRIIKNVCESYRNIKLFMHQFSSFPYILRWFFHMLAYSHDNDFSNSSVDSSLSSHLSSLLKNSEPTEHYTSTSVDSVNEVLLDGLAIEEKNSGVQVFEEKHNDDLAIDEVSRVDKNIDSEDSCDEKEFSEDVEDLYDENENSADGEDCYDENEDSEDDEDGWITPSNLKDIKNRISPEDIHEEIHTACITADYACQNTLKHIGLKVIGVDGKIIHNLRTYILRCYACFKTTDKMDLLFCKNCGNKTLKKVAVTSNPDGTQKIWISTRKPINIRGTKFSLPRPRGGKHAINPILVADQREAQQRATKLARMKSDPLNDNYVTGFSPFVQRDVYSRSAQLGITSGKKQHRGLFYWEQRNPNEAMKKKSGRKK